MIDQAKGVIVGQTGCSPDDAFRRLVAVSRNRNVKVREVARAVLDRAQRARRLRRARGRAAGCPAEYRSLAGKRLVRARPGPRATRRPGPGHLHLALVADVDPAPRTRRLATTPARSADPCRCRHSRRQPARPHRPETERVSLRRCADRHRRRSDSLLRSPRRLRGRTTTATRGFQARRAMVERGQPASSQRARSPGLGRFVFRCLEVSSDIP
jgi:hypothetical protein